jgi:hypothetical protein
MVEFIIEELASVLDSFSAVQCHFLSENCIVALEDNSHVTGCMLKVVGDQTNDFRLLWSKNFARAGYVEKKKITEKAAEAISFFLSNELTGYSVIEEAVIGTGVDYWLGYESSHDLYDPKNFLKARLEISGIDRETVTNSLERRVKEKKKQTGPTDPTGLEAYISVVVFSAPRAYFGKK